MFPECPLCFQSFWNFRDNFWKRKGHGTINDFQNPDLIMNKSVVDNRFFELMRAGIGGEEPIKLMFIFYMLNASGTVIAKL